MSMEGKQDNKQGALLRDRFTVMVDWVKVIRDFPGDDFKAVFLALADFACYGKEFDGSEANECTKVAVGLILPQVRRMVEKCDKRADSSRTNGKKGGRPRKATGSPGDDGEGGDDGIRAVAQGNLNNPVGFLSSDRFCTEKPNKTLIEDKRIEDKDKIKENNQREEEGKKSASIQSDAISSAYSSSSLERTFNFIDSSFSQPFSNLLIYFAKSHKDRIPKTEEEFRDLYNKMIELAENDPGKARKVVEQAVAKNWGGVFPLKPPTKDEVIRGDVDNMLAKYGLTSEDVGI